MSKPTPRTDTELKRVGRFGAVGVLNTIIDFVIYNLLSRKVRMVAELAKVISSTVAMIVSFVLNKGVVFRNQQKAVAGQALRFFVVTGINLYVLQVGIIYLLTNVWTGLTTLADNVAAVLHLSGIFSHDFMQKNVPFVVAISAGLVWNYLLYKKVVFKS